MAVNMVVLMGRLVRDPDVRYIQNADNSSVARFTIAVERDYKAQGEEKPKTNFISCVAWNKTAEFVEKHFRQGNMIAVTGEIETGSYEKDGKKVYTTDVKVNKVSFTGEKRGDATEGRPEPSATDSDGFMNIPDGIDEELPFN